MKVEKKKKDKINIVYKGLVVEYLNCFGFDEYVLDGEDTVGRYLTVIWYEKEHFCKRSYCFAYDEVPIDVALGEIVYIGEGGMFVKATGEVFEGDNIYLFRLLSDYIRVRKLEIGNQKVGVIKNLMEKELKKLINNVWGKNGKQKSI